MMNDENIYARLKRVFHEPNRLAILSLLCKEPYGLKFNDLKDSSNLTFGNLSSHLKTLQEADIVEVQKHFEDNKPCTTVVLTDSGREQFVIYLNALETVLKTASEAIASQEEKSSEIWERTAQA